MTTRALKNPQCLNAKGGERVAPLVAYPPISRGPGDFDRLLRTEWLLTNGLGGFAMGTALTIPTRRYHALLIAATTPPVGRIVALHSVVEQLVIDPATPRERVIELSAFEFGGQAGGDGGGGGVVHPDGHALIRVCEIQPDRVSWTYSIPDAGLEIVKSLAMVKGENACTLTYDVQTVSGAGAVPRAQLRLRPLVAMRDFHALWRRDWFTPFSHASAADAVRVERDGRTLAIQASSRATFRHDPQWWYNLFHRGEAERHQDCLQDLHSPGVFTCDSSPDVGAKPWGLTINAVLEPRPDRTTGRDDDAPSVYPNAAARVAMPASSTRADREALDKLAAAADAFVVRRTDHARRDSLPGHGAGMSIIAGYPWFSDWGRDTFISLPGLLLCTGRFDEARATLATFAAARRNGLIPNVFNDQTGEPEYNTSDGSLWFIHAACEYVERSRDYGVLGGEIGRACLDVIAHYRRGTDHNIAMDPFDKLIAAGSESSQLTWMDARRDGVTFTPRFGKPVEINALWCSALLRLADLLAKEQPTLSANLRDLGAAAGKSFASAFWNDRASCLFDCLVPVGGGDGWAPSAEIRPNQLFAVSLPHSPLTAEQQRSVLACVRSRLLTPLGVRTLDPADRRYRGRYEGSLFDRDAAYHQGTAWPWLTGVLAIAILRAGNFSEQSKREARDILAPLLTELNAAGPNGGCTGFLAEVYDGDTPQRPGGCPAQAWSIATVLQAMCMLS